MNNLLKVALGVVAVAVVGGALHHFANKGSDVVEAGETVAEATETAETAEAVVEETVASEATA